MALAFPRSSRVAGLQLTVIGRLAVSRTHAGRGLGADILADAPRRIAIASQSIGIGAVLVHAKDENTKRFHMRCAEFIEYPVDSRTMPLPIETVLAALSQDRTQHNELRHACGAYSAQRKEE